MSIDYYVSVKSLDKFSSANFFTYAAKFGVKLWVEEAFDLNDAEGFQPFLLNVDFIDTISNEETFLSGFEIYISEYKSVPENFETTKLTFWQRLFKRKSVTVTPTFPSSTANCGGLSVSINCSSVDSFEVLLAYILGAYICKEYGGDFDDPQTGRTFVSFEDMEKEINLLKEDLKRDAQNGELCTHHPQ